MFPSDPLTLVCIGAWLTILAALIAVAVWPNGTGQTVFAAVTRSVPASVPAVEILSPSNGRVSRFWSIPVDSQPSHARAASSSYGWSSAPAAHRNSPAYQSCSRFATVHAAASTVCWAGNTGAQVRTSPSRRRQSVLSLPSRSAGFGFRSRSGDAGSCAAPAVFAPVYALTMQHAGAR
jgi:hypothetical protein